MGKGPEASTVRTRLGPLSGGFYELEFQERSLGRISIEYSSAFQVCPVRGGGLHGLVGLSQSSQLVLMPAVELLCLVFAAFLGLEVRCS